MGETTTRPTERAGTYTPDARPAPLPVAEAERITSMDVLRGIAVLGILVMNIQAFAMIGAAYPNPTAYGDLNGANRWVWMLSHVLADQKFISIFSMLFGAGIVLMASKAESADSAKRLHYRRMAWLVLFGLLHAHLLWYGDVLFTYGVCGMVVYRFRNQPPRRLVVLGVLVLAVSSAISLGTGWSMRFWPPEAMDEFAREGWQPTAERVAREVAAYRGGWLDQMRVRSPGALLMETVLFLMFLAWKAAGMMLIGMALFKLGVFSARRSRHFYLMLIAAAILIGIPVTAYGVHRNFAVEWDVRYSFFTGSQYNYWGSLFVALGWVGAVMLVCKSQRLAPLTRPFAAVGRTAFSNYILQSVICTTIFYGHGLALFGSVDRVAQIAIVVAIWAVQLVISPLWLRYFLFGPLEWLWRSLAYWTRQPMRRSVAPAGAL